VKQFHFTNWPDKVVPEDPRELVNFVNFVNEQVPQKDNPGRPLIVHCR